MSRIDDPMPCRRLVELASDYLDGVLPADSVALITEHLGGCDGCAAYLEQLQLVIGACAEVGDGEVPEAVLDALVHAFRRQGR